MEHVETGHNRKQNTNGTSGRGRGRSSGNEGPIRRIRVGEIVSARDIREFAAGAGVGNEGHTTRPVCVYMVRVCSCMKCVVCVFVWCWWW